jgi:hypothetical protein
MTLTIDKLSTRCRSPKSFGRASALVDEVTRGPFVPELSAQLGPSLDRLPEVVRLRNLQVRLKVSARRLSPTSLANAWARALTLALHRALAYPDGDGTYVIRRYQNQATYRAAMIYHVATQGLSSQWEFPELDGWISSSPPETCLGVLLSLPELVVEILMQLARDNRLEPVLALWDEVLMEQVIRAMGNMKEMLPELKLEDFIALGRAATIPEGLFLQWSIASRRQAARLWLRLSRRFHIRAVWHGLRLLQRFLETPSLVQSDATLLSNPIPFPAWCEAIVTEVRGGGIGISPAQSRNGVAEFFSVLQDLRPLVPSAARPGETGTWVSSECAGILLLLSTVRRIDLWRLVRDPEFIRFGGPRALSFILVGIGMKLIGNWSAADPIDTAVALFAGIFGDTDRIGMKQFFAEANVQAVAEIVPADNWNVALESLATAMTVAFAQRIRGFRQVSRDAVVKQFLCIPGRVLVEEQRLLVVLETSPWSIALHIAGMDESLENVEWLAGRRVNFVLEGL